MRHERIIKSAVTALLACTPFVAYQSFCTPAFAETAKKTAPAAHDKHAADKAPAQDKSTEPMSGDGFSTTVEAMPPPWNGIRAFLRSHDRIVLGDNSASTSLALLRKDQAKLFENIPAESWNDPAMRQAAAIYVLAGGNVDVLKPALAAKNFKGKEEELLKGVMAYGTGLIADAETLLAPFDALDFTPALGGHLALAQALLVSRNNQKKALEYLDTARLLLPGTLVEEAALRHTLSVAAKLGDRDHFLFAAGSYLRRFSNSSYASTFRRQLVVLLVQWPHGDNLVLLTEIARSIPPKSELGAGFMLVSVAEQATYSGNVALARSAIEAAFPYYQDDSDTRQRLLLYHGIAQIFLDRPEAGLAQLKRITRTRLRPADAQLLTTALDLGVRLHQDFKGDGGAGTTKSAANTSASREDSVRNFPMSDTRKYATDLLAQTDALLTKAK